MLELKRQDLGKNPTGKPGVHVWWRSRPDRPKHVMVVAWPDLVLLKPSIMWPCDMHPERRAGWKTSTFRFAWVKELANVQTFRGIPVPDLDATLELRRGCLDRLKVLKRLVHLSDSKKLSVLEGVAGRRVYIGRGTLRRMSAAIEQPERELDLRLAAPEWAPGSLLVLAYRNGLRAIASAISEQEAIGDSGNAH